MAKKEGKKIDHFCPPIPAGWSIKATGPRYIEGEGTEVSRKKWEAWLRMVARMRPMPRTTK